MQNSLKQIDTLLNEYIELRKTECGGGSDLLSMQISEKNSEILLKFDEITDLRQLGNLPKNCDHNRFFEVICEQTRVHGIKAQKTLAHLTNF